MEEWEDLLKQRVKDALRRSQDRNCNEVSYDILYKEAKKLLLKQKFLCAICGIQMQTKGPITASLDRIYSSVSPSRTGPKCSYFHNCRWLCFKCNHEMRSCHMKHAKYKSSKC